MENESCRSSDGTDVGQDEAAASAVRASDASDLLGQLETDRQRLTARVRTPWWWFPTFGALIMVILIAMAVGASARVPVPAKIVAMVILIVAVVCEGSALGWYRETTGIGSMKLTGRGRWVLFVLAVVPLVIGFVVSLGVPLATGGSRAALWGVVGVDVIVAIVYAVMGTAGDAELRRTIAQRASDGGAVNGGTRSAFVDSRDSAGVSPTSGSSAGASALLEQMSEDRRRLADRVATPWWYYPAFGGLITVVFIAMSIGMIDVESRWIDVVVFLVLVSAAALECGIMIWYERTFGITVIARRANRRSWALAICLGVIGLVGFAVSLMVPLAHGRTFEGFGWVVLVDVLVGILYVVIGRAYDTELRRVLVRGLRPAGDSRAVADE